MTPRGALRSASRVSSPSVPPFSKVYRTHSALNTPAPMNSGKTSFRELSSWTVAAPELVVVTVAVCIRLPKCLPPRMNVSRQTTMTTDSSRTMAHLAIRPRTPIRAMFQSTAITAAITMMISSVWKLGARLNSGWISVGRLA